LNGVYRVDVGEKFNMGRWIRRKKMQIADRLRMWTGALSASVGKTAIVGVFTRPEHWC
jgi:hypothetical protein